MTRVMHVLGSIAASLVCAGIAACGARVSAISPASCSDNGAVHPSGTSWTCSDGCNSCSCSNGQMATRFVPCFSRIPPDDAGEDTDAGAGVCMNVNPTNYDQTCTVDSDCVVVSAGIDTCVPSCHCWGSATVNASALVQYQADIAAALSLPSVNLDCPCGAQPPHAGPCCVSGQCNLFACEPLAADSGVAAEAGLAPAPSDGGAEASVGINAPTMPCPNDPPCEAGVCPVIPIGTAAGSGFTLALAVGGSRVYWANNGSSAVYAPTGSIGYVDRCGAGGGTIATQQKDPYNIAADANGACWTNLGTTIGGTYQNDGETWCWDGVSANLLASGESSPWGLALDGSTLFWANGGEEPIDVEVVSANRVGGPMRVLFGARYIGEPYLALDAETIYVAGATPNVIAIDRSSTASRSLAQGNRGPIAVDATNIYVKGINPTGSPAPLVSLPKGGGDATTLLTDCTGDQIVADGRYVYCMGSGGVERVPVGGGAPQVIATGGAYSLAGDGVYIYFGEGDTIERVRSP